ncbi:SRPBCC family protein [Leifsonia poae]|uniref:SRPBCC family protein n=1 Tax=Leifsonia poae TaxID=110933 RepID=UPI003D677D98
MPDYSTAVDIRATPEEIFDYLVTPAGLTAWMGQHADLDPVEGGLFSVDISGSPIRGRFLEVTRPERVVVSWGVAGNDEFPPGSTTVTFTLTPLEHGTRVDLQHGGLPDIYSDGHRDGWAHFLPRLCDAAEGLVPGDDSDWLPLARRT